MKIEIKTDKGVLVHSVNIPFEFEDNEQAAIIQIKAMLDLHYVTDTCWRCCGKGHIVNPAVDGFSTMDERAQDEEFMENYFGGVYDIPCTECGGHGVLNMSPDEVEARMMRHEDEAVYRAEMRMLGEY